MAWISTLRLSSPPLRVAGHRALYLTHLSLPRLLPYRAHYHATCLCSSLFARPSTCYIAWKKRHICLAPANCCHHAPPRTHHLYAAFAYRTAAHTSPRCTGALRSMPCYLCQQRIRKETRGISCASPAHSALHSPARTPRICPLPRLDRALCSHRRLCAPLCASNIAIIAAYLIFARKQPNASTSTKEGRAGENRALRGAHQCAL